MVHHSIDFKKSAVKYYLKIKNYVEVCKIYECNRSSPYNPQTNPIESFSMS